jgi:hypothetical protein
VSTAPGLREMAVTPNCLPSTAIASVSPMTPYFVVLYARGMDGRAPQQWFYCCQATAASAARGGSFRVRCNAFSALYDPQLGMRVISEFGWATARKPRR